MLIDWFTVFAQIINFFVLIILLKLFLYGPIVEAMKKRKERVADEMMQAHRTRSEAEELHKSLETKHRELEHKASHVMSEIHAESAKWRHQAMVGAQKEIEVQREEWLSALAREKQSLALSLKKRVMKEVSGAASRIILDLTDSNLEERVVVGLLVSVEKETSKVDCGKSEIIVRTGFVHDGQNRERTEAALARIFPGCTQRVFTVDPNLGIGVELIAGDRKWEWSLSSYVVDLEKSIFEEIAAEPLVVSADKSKKDSGGGL
ncbi:MAG: ATPase [Desulfovibrio sp. S3730MH75]|nr:MAG: ATPase [Desulfovibrio sp. S3730MH75]